MKPTQASSLHTDTSPYSIFILYFHVGVVAGCSAVTISCSPPPLGAEIGAGIWLPCLCSVLWSAAIQMRRGPGIREQSQDIPSLHKMGRGLAESSQNLPKIITFSSTNKSYCSKKLFNCCCCEGDETTLHWPGCCGVVIWPSSNFLMSAIIRVRPWAVQCQYTHHHALIWTNNYLEILVPFPNIHCLCYNTNL